MTDSTMDCLHHDMVSFVMLHGQRQYATTALDNLIFKVSPQYFPRKNDSKFPRKLLDILRQFNGMAISYPKILCQTLATWFFIRYVIYVILHNFI